MKSDIAITAGDTPGTQKVVVKSTKELTKKQLVKAMGAQATKFVVTDVKEAKG